VRDTVLVGLGGMVGSIARFWLTVWLQRLAGTPFPLGTVTVNVLGSFVLGVVLALTLQRGEATHPMRALLGVGFCGGFTTMSTFSYETLALWYDGQVAFATGNVLLTLAACVLAVWLGLIVGRAA
jgi:CrcB protein